VRLARCGRPLKADVPATNGFERVETFPRQCTPRVDGAAVESESPIAVAGRRGGEPMIREAVDNRIPCRSRETLRPGGQFNDWPEMRESAGCQMYAAYALTQFVRAPIPSQQTRQATANG
jgi:hypothetical protein